MHYLHPKRGPRGDTEDGNEGVETVTHVNDDSKDSVALKGNYIYYFFIFILIK